MSGAHSNEERLREAYALFARGDFDGFLGYCTDDVTFSIPVGRYAGTYDRAGLVTGIVAAVVETAGDTFREEIVDVYANDEHAAVLLDHRFTRRDGERIAFRTVHRYTIRDGKFASWEEWPGDVDAFIHGWR